MDNYLAIQKMDVSEVNMDSCPIISGFPSIPAIMGFVHALQRKLQVKYPDLLFSRAGVSCHSFSPRIHRTGGRTKLSLTKNPPYLKKHTEKNRNGLLKGVPFIEEGKADMCVSVLIQVRCESVNFRELCDDVSRILPHLRFSGGTIWHAENIRCETLAEENDHTRILRLLMPGFVLIERRDLMENLMDEGKDALDSLLDHLEVSRIKSKEDQTDIWQRKSGEPGWLVPIAVGYRTISAPGKVDNQRHPDCLHSFAENMVTLGEFVMPVGLENVENALWQADIDEGQGIFVYVNQREGE